MKLTPLQRRRTLYRLADLYEKAQREHPTETPAQHHARAFAWIGCEPEFANHAARMRINQPERLAKWTNEQASPKTWKKPKNGRPFQLPEFPGLDSAPKGRTPTVRVVGQIDGHGQTFQASPTAPADGSEVMQLVNANVEGQSPPVNVDGAIVDPLAAGTLKGPIDYSGEPLIRAALSEALRERRRGREMHNQDAGELDLSRIAPTALGLDLDRAFSRRIKPDVRGCAVFIALDASGSMRQFGRGEAAKRAAAIAYRALARAGIKVALSQYGDPREVRPAPGVPEQWRDVIGWNDAQSHAQTELDVMPEWYSYDTHAPKACARACAELAKRHEPRRVLMLICDGAVRAEEPQWRNARAAGVELWPILLGSDAVDGADSIERAGWSSVPPIVVPDPAELVPIWTKTLRAHLGRVAV